MSRAGPYRNSVCCDMMRMIRGFFCNVPAAVIVVVV
jgi:hypothetical protein